MTGGEGASKAVETTGFPMYMDVVMQSMRRRGDMWRSSAKAATTPCI
jgi:hypothetical protein